MEIVHNEAMAREEEEHLRRVQQREDKRKEEEEEEEGGKTIWSRRLPRWCLAPLSSRHTAGKQGDSKNVRERERGNSC